MAEGRVIPALSIPAVILLFIVISQFLWVFLAHRRTKKREHSFASLPRTRADMIALIDTKGHRLYNSPSYERVLGYTTRELAVTPIFEQIHPDDASTCWRHPAMRAPRGVGKSLQYRLRHKNGSWRILESTASTIKNERGEVEKLVIVNRDVTERAAAEGKLAHNGLHDALTDLPNRSLFLGLNINTALDDFGNNAILLASLRRCSYDVLKIERSLISGMQAESSSRDVVGLILMLAGKLNCEVVAEGVEKPAQLETLRSLDCRLAQAYFFSAPRDSKPRCNSCRGCSPPLRRPADTS